MTATDDRMVVLYEPGSEAAMCSELISALTTEPNRFFADGMVVREIVQTKQGDFILRRATALDIQCALSRKAVLAAAVAGKSDLVRRAIPASLARMMLKAHAHEFPPLPEGNR
jgi:hypothetical protein